MLVALVLPIVEVPVVEYMVVALLAAMVAPRDFGNSGQGIPGAQPTHQMIQLLFPLFPY